MRLLTCRHFRLGAIALLAGATGAAAHPSPQGPLAERGTRALGFDLRTGEGGSFSVWKVSSPYTAVGLEASLSLGLTENDYDDPGLSNESYQSLRLQLRPTFKRYRSVRNGIAPYVYYQALGGFSGLRSDGEEPWREYSSSKIEVGVGVGLGVDWFPLKRISVGGRTGLSLSYGFGEGSQSDPRSGRVDMQQYIERDLYLRAFVSKVTAFVYF